MRKYNIFIILVFILFALNPSISKSKVVNSVGLGLGVCVPQGGWDPGYTIVAQADFGEAIKYVYLSPYLSYANAGKTEELNNNPENLSIQYIGLGVKLTGYLNSKPRGFYLGGAMSYNIISYDTIDWAEFDQNTKIVNKNTAKVGFGGLVGYLFVLKKLSVFIEIDYMLTAGGFNNLSVITGLNINL